MLKSLITVGERNGHTNSEGDCNFCDYLTHKKIFFSFCQIDKTAIIRIIKNNYEDFTE